MTVYRRIAFSNRLTISRRTRMHGMSLCPSSPFFTARARFGDRGDVDEQTIFYHFVALLADIDCYSERDPLSAVSMQLFNCNVMLWAVDEWNPRKQMMFRNTDGRHYSAVKPGWARSAVFSECSVNPAAKPVASISCIERAAADVSHCPFHLVCLPSGLPSACLCVVVLPAWRFLLLLEHFILLACFLHSNSFIFRRS